MMGLFAHEEGEGERVHDLHQYACTVVMGIREEACTVRHALNPVCLYTHQFILY